MSDIGSYVLRVICTAILCGLVCILFEKEPTLSSVLKLVTGLILTVTVISPLLRDDVLQLDQILDSVTAEKDAAVSAGEIAARNSMAEIITERTCTYILNKANALEADVQVFVELDDGYPPAPASVTVSGVVSPYVKKQLADIIQRDLGIAEEDQRWI